MRKLPAIGMSIGAGSLVFVALIGCSIVIIRFPGLMEYLAYLLMSISGLIVS